MLEKRFKFYDFYQNRRNSIQFGKWIKSKILKMKKICLVLFGLVLTIQNLSAQTISQSYEVNPIHKKFVLLPVKTGAPKTWMTVKIDEVWQTEFEIELHLKTPIFMLPLK